MSYTIKSVEAGPSSYHVLLDAQGYPRAQGSLATCQKTKAQLEELESLNPLQVWLQPSCPRCEPESEGRQWCDQDAWGPCETCGLPAVAYDLSRTQPLR